MVKTARWIVRFCRSFWLSRRGVSAGPNLVTQGRILVYRSKGSRIELGARIVLNARPGKNTLEARGPVILRTFRPGAEIIVGDDSGLTSCTISSGLSVELGRRVLLGGGVVITDSDHHVVDIASGRRFAGLPHAANDRPVKIGDDVFIGARSIILKGVEIGNGSVIGAGSVVSASIPAGVVAAGNPCTVLRPLREAGQ
ncbi:DapH/DapD/GlmU-related protein [Arthrobacter sp. PvP023]|uniref:acyltransferase n=1 Tax=Arthrobacter sp. PvP023 TaxID=2806585 RepID=UPI001AE1A6B2|nr:acyltransferase [Arthrobacter sp. PvP023]